MEEIKFSHYSVMLGECIDILDIKPDGTYVDCTLGGGGHSLEIAKRLTAGGRLICIDTDECAITAAKKRLCDYSDRITFVHGNFSDISEILRDIGIDGIDLGVSSYQLDTPERGFSYNTDAPLDMRMNAEGSPEKSKSAYTVVNTYSESELRRILFEYGEENFAPKIASAIVKARENAPIKTTLELVDIIKSVMPKKALAVGHHPAKRTFQAIRIEVNDELGQLEKAVSEFCDVLAPGGRLCIITFHSLEDRIVKEIIAKRINPCTCPKEFPVCVCGKVGDIEKKANKPILPSPEEIERNPRARSAKLRIAQKK